MGKGKEIRGGGEGWEGGKRGNEDKVGRKRRRVKKGGGKRGNGEVERKRRRVKKGGEVLCLHHATVQKSDHHLLKYTSNLFSYVYAVHICTTNSKGALESFGLIHRM